MYSNGQKFNRIAAPDRAETGKLNARMYAAIAQDDQRALEAALESGANPDADDGKALRLCASTDKYLLAKTLMLAGGDIGYALMQARRENDAIPRRTDVGMILTFSTPVTEEGKKREVALAREISKLESFQKSFLDSSLPMEQMNLLREIRAAQYDLARRMDTMEKTLREIDSPKPLDKKPARGQPAAARLKRGGA
ncbi:MAG: hypothetical protein Q8K65_03435 [Alphaproteobacteria bacterium]|nr:hypothetical protein [Alphaproteobacteria bacterium]